jgi:hypothetical protein
MAAADRSRRSTHVVLSHSCSSAQSHPDIYRCINALGMVSLLSHVDTAWGATVCTVILYAGRFELQMRATVVNMATLSFFLYFMSRRLML